MKMNWDCQPNEYLSLDSAPIFIANFSSFCYEMLCKSGDVEHEIIWRSTKWLQI